MQNDDKSKNLAKLINEMAAFGLCDAIGEGISIHDIDFRIIYQNKTSREIFGDHAGEYCYKAYHGTDSPDNDCPQIVTYKDGQSHLVEKRLQTYKGVMDFEILSSPLRDPEGNIIAGIEIWRDITSRKKAETAAHEERGKSEKYLNIADVMLIAINSDEKISLINQKGSMVLGGREEDIVGKNWFDTFIPEKIREDTRGVFRKLMAGEIKSTRYHENPIIPFDGFERIIAWHNTILRDDSGKIIGTLSSGEDITDRKRMEKEIKTRMEELEAFYSIAVGRELKMKELKVEIEKLQNALSKK